MEKAFGKYFDGISSKPQEIELQLYEINAELRFGISSESNNWAIEDISFELIGKTLEIRSREHSLALIKVEDAEFIDGFITFLKTEGKINWYQRIFHMGIKAQLLLAVVVLGLIAGGFLLVVPWVAEKAVTLIPTRYDISMGHSFYNQYLKNNSVDSAKSEALNLFAGQLQLHNTQDLHFSVINSSTVNAFALPDGNIIVFTGLLDLMKDYDELAALIGHEVSHVNNRHSMKMLCRNLSGYLFISAVLSDVNGIMAVIGNNIQNLQSLSYSRQFEREADEQGTDLMILNGINPKGMLDLFTRLQSSEKVVLPTFISSHPITSQRIEFIKKRISHTHHQYSLNQNLDELFHEIK